MNDLPRRWRGTDYPSRRPDCDGATAMRMPRGGALRVLVWGLFAAFLGLGILDPEHMPRVNSRAPEARE